MTEFSINALISLYHIFLKKYSFGPIQQLSSYPGRKHILVRHDVDRTPGKALKLARLEQKMAIQATYYFRTTAICSQLGIIREISNYGHEIGYHYENLSSCVVKLGLNRKWLSQLDKLLHPLLEKRMNNPQLPGIEIKSELKKVISNLDTHSQMVINSFFQVALEDFEQNLTKLREIADVKTIAMHGSPLIPIDNRLLWLHYDYRNYGIEFEPYFDIDYNEVLYITDAGRTWHDSRANQRDKVDSGYKCVFRHIDEIAVSAQKEELPEHIIFNIHPEHWTDNVIEWYYIYLVRAGKNALKRLFL